MDSNVTSLLVSAVIGAFLVSLFLRFFRSNSSVGVLVDDAGRVPEPPAMSIKGNSKVEWRITNQYNADVVVTMQNFRLKLDNGGIGKPVKIFKSPAPSDTFRAGAIDKSLPAEVDAKGWWLWLWWWLLKPKHIKYDIVVTSGGRVLSELDPEIEMYDKN